MLIYNKLVRDKIPDIITNTWKIPTIHIADRDEYWLKLKEKLQEEVAEFLEDTNIEEELADVLEVIYAICECKNISKTQLETLRQKKKEERGGFQGRIILEEVKEG